jgi:hypothetical protein
MAENIDFEAVVELKSENNEKKFVFVTKNE